MSIYRKNKNSMKQAEKERIQNNLTARKEEKTILFQIEEEKDNETILQPGKIWCDGCYAWIDQVTKTDTNWLCCDTCGNGVVILV